MTSEHVEYLEPVEAVEVDGRFAVLDADGVAVNVIVATPDVAQELAAAGAFPDAVGLRNVTGLDPMPAPGWTWDRGTRTWSAPPPPEQEEAP